MVARLDGNHGAPWLISTGKTKWKRINRKRIRKTRRSPRILMISTALKVQYDKALADNKSLLNFALGKLGKKDDGKGDLGFKSTDTLEDEDQQAIADKRKKDDNDIVESLIKIVK